MKKYGFEKLDDWFINLYEEGLFVRCFEYSAILIWEIFWYKIFPNIDKKTGFIFLEFFFFFCIYNFKIYNNFVLIFNYKKYVNVWFF